MAKTQSLWGVAVVAAVLAGSAAAQPDKEQKGEEPVAPPRPPEMKVLDRFLGTWTTEIVNRPVDGTQKEVKSHGISKFEWALDGRFLRCVGKAAPPEKGESLQLMTFNPGRKEYYMWFFDSFGSVSEAAGKWDDESKTLTWQGEPEENLVSLNRIRFVDKDTIQWVMTIKDKNNKLYLDVHGKMTRRK
jgi:uncharacterized protein DUF1579